MVTIGTINGTNEKSLTSIVQSNYVQSMDLLRGLREIHERLLEGGSTGEMVAQGVIDSNAIPSVKETLQDTDMNLEKVSKIVSDILEQLK